MRKAYNIMCGYLATSVCRFACHPHLSAFSGRFLNGFSEGKKLVACFLKLVARISKSEPLIFSLLPRGVNGVKTSFHFFDLKFAVFPPRFSGFLCPRYGARLISRRELPDSLHVPPFGRRFEQPGCGFGAAFAVDCGRHYSAGIACPLAAGEQSPHGERL